jgi:prevent-host-death family protein
MLDITKDIESLTTFRRRSGDFMKQLKKTKRPVVLTVKGKARAVVQDAKLISGCSTLPRRRMLAKGFGKAWNKQSKGWVATRKSSSPNSGRSMVFLVRIRRVPLRTPARPYSPHAREYSSLHTTMRVANLSEYIRSLQVPEYSGSLQQPCGAGF